MRQLKITFTFYITNDKDNDYDCTYAYQDLADYMIDETGDAIYGMGLEPIDYPCYKIEEVEQNVGT